MLSQTCHLSPWSGLIAVEEGEAPVEEDLGVRLRPQLVHPWCQVQEHPLLPLLLTNWICKSFLHTSIRSQICEFDLKSVSIWKHSQYFDHLTPWKDIFPGWQHHRCPWERPVWSRGPPSQWVSQDQGQSTLGFWPTRYMWPSAPGLPPKLSETFICKGLFFTPCTKADEWALISDTHSILIIWPRVQTFFQADNIIGVHEKGQLEVDVFPVSVRSEVQIGPHWDSSWLSICCHNTHTHQQGCQPDRQDHLELFLQPYW